MWMCGCGAPTKSAGDVAHLFDAITPTLQGKVTDLCQLITARDKNPSVKNLDINMSGCGDAGKAALNYSQIKSFHFLGLNEATSSGEDEEEFVVDLRAQVWLNRSMLNFALSVINGMSSDASQSDDVIWSSKNDLGSMEGLIKPKITKIEEPKINKKDYSFGAKLNIQIEGLVNVNNDISLKGGLIDNKFVATLKTIDSTTPKDSFIKATNGVILILPHADDVYIDFFIRARIINVGLKSVVQNKIKTAFGSGLKVVLDKLLAL